MEKTDENSALRRMQARHHANVAQANSKLRHATQASILRTRVCDKGHMGLEAQVRRFYEGGDKAREVLNRCLDEMQYAGWSEPIKDNVGRLEVFSAVLNYLHPPVEGETVKKVKWKIALKLSGESKSSMDMTGYIGTQAKDAILEILERDFQEEPIKQMIGLTAQEIGAIWDKEGTGFIPQKQLQFYMDCETKLREKNG